MTVGVVTLPSIGTKIDPEMHEAIEMAEVDALEESFVTTEYSRGYKFGDLLLRPARVQVGKVRAPSDAE